MEQKIPEVKKIVRTVPLRILRPKYSDAIEEALGVFKSKDKKNAMNTNVFWKAIRDRNLDFFKGLGLSNGRLAEIREDTFFKLGLDNKTLFDYLNFLQGNLMKEYNKIISNIYLEREKKEDFESDLKDEDIEIFIEKQITRVYGSYLGKGIKSVVQSNLGGNFVRSVKVDGEVKKIKKLTAINMGLMGLPIARSESFPISIIKTGADYIKFLTSSEEPLETIEEYETGEKYGDLLVQITLPYFSRDNGEFVLITSEQASQKYGTGKRDLLNIFLIMTTYAIRKKKQWGLDGSAQSLVREIANKELQKKWKEFYDHFIEKYGEAGKLKLLRGNVNLKSRAEKDKGRELTLDERLDRLYESIDAKSYPSQINLIPDKWRWKLHFTIDIPPTLNWIDPALYGGIDFGEQNIATLCVRNEEKNDYDFLTIYGNDLLSHARTAYARRRIMRVQDGYKATGHGKARKTKSQEEYSERMQKLRQKITERLIKQISDFFLWRNKFHNAVCSLRYEDLNTLYKGETARAKRLRQFINKQQLFNGVERRLKEYHSNIYVNSRFPHYTSKLCSKCGKLNLYFDFFKFRTKNLTFKKLAGGEEIKYYPFFICEFCGWKQSADKNASANIADKNYQVKLDEEKKVCNFERTRKKENTEDELDDETTYTRRFNKTSLIYEKLKKKINKDDIFELWKRQLKRKLLPKEHKEYKERFDYLFSYYQEIVKNESKS